MYDIENDAHVCPRGEHIKSESDEEVVEQCLPGAKRAGPSFGFGLQGQVGYAPVYEPEETYHDWTTPRTSDSAYPKKESASPRAVNE